jgi:hypothetical protein
MTPGGVLPMVWVFLFIGLIYLFVIILADDPRTTFPWLAKKLTPGQEEFVERLRQWIEYLHLGAFLLMLYAAVVLWLAYKYLR